MSEITAVVQKTQTAVVALVMTQTVVVALAISQTAVMTPWTGVVTLKP